MSALSDLLAAHTTLDAEQTAHLQRLVAEWQLLSDLSFADLLLWVPMNEQADDGGTEFLCAAQCRPTTGPTAYLHDWVGQRLSGQKASALRVAMTESRIFRESDPDWEGDTPIRREAIPILFNGAAVAVLGRDSNLTSVRSPSQLELAYLQSAADLASMVAAGAFPGPATDREEAAGPRVGDGMVRVDDRGAVLYASPNASSAFRRLGFTGNLLGSPLASAVAELARDPFDAADLEEMLIQALAGGHPFSREVDGGGAIVQFRAIPLHPRGQSLGALVLLQDVTELRRRDRQIMSKDATIREIHHRVKNNLQTVAALLRLQSRRLANPEARTALEESMRRVSSIALVHETLSSAIDEAVDFDEVVDRLLDMLVDVTGAVGRVLVRRIGSFGELPAELATPLVMVLTELVGNAVEHGFAGDRSGSVEVSGRRSRGTLLVTVTDDGVGLPDGFSIGSTDRLGLQIVRTLVDAELDAVLELTGRDDGRGGTSATVRIPLSRKDRGSLA
ncbi:PAS domain-containing sensor histidine kinase [Jatrophihabitans telluris]|uniref:histidine kinase n=1 Tax=Jatrophihabitans telluris TaxID=2038343 RepID=A0ABY4R3Q7_9ACTN|nr:PAS domain-containing sensor histidine kinase [Jatrophihabitans telluris]UQX89811.1 PAS domain-containing sensor histidine kinase [Jatrophihabitans telluris]